MFKVNASVYNEIYIDEDETKWRSTASLPFGARSLCSRSVGAQGVEDEDANPYDIFGPGAAQGEHGGEAWGLALATRSFGFNIDTEAGGWNWRWIAIGR